VVPSGDRFTNPGTIDQPQVAKWQARYSKVDLEAEFEKMDSFLSENPKRTYKSRIRFVVNWLGREHRRVQAETKVVDVERERRLGRQREHEASRPGKITPASPKTLAALDALSRGKRVGRGQTLKQLLKGD
jgi:hypothetical protein